MTGPDALPLSLDQLPPIPFDRLVVRWTIGDVHPRGFEMLRLSVCSARRMFGPAAQFVIFVNSLSLEEAQRRSGDLPPETAWRLADRRDLPAVLAPFFDTGLIEGMGWKLMPLRVAPERYELALDNDCILWDLPAGMRAWLSRPDASLFAEDVDRCLGVFDPLCPPGSYNAGIRGLPPGADLAAELAAVLRQAEERDGVPLRLEAEIEEQGLQAAAMCRRDPLFLVRTAEVSICSPFWPRSPELGSCGAHFTGSNAHHIPWNYYDRPADAWLDEHWARHRPELYRRAGLPLPPAGAAATNPPPAHPIE